MTNVKLARQNQRWLRAAHIEVQEVSQLLFLSGLECDKVNPQVDWTAIQTKLANAMRIVSYANKESNPTTTKPTE